ncbi:MAG: hypothetical protein EVA89_09210 [Sandaracinaceae bacterium]|nr:MAG: hypothetical protein EVA89_09210 [Sandaracinaceae bacterium]
MVSRQRGRWVHEALGLFSPENGLDHATASEVLRHQLEAPAWREGLREELSALLRDAETDWMSVVDNDEFRVGEFDGTGDARAFVERLLGPFV